MVETPRKGACRERAQSLNARELRLQSIACGAVGGYDTNRRMKKFAVQKDHSDSKSGREGTGWEHETMRGYCNIPKRYTKGSGGATEKKERTREAFEGPHAQGLVTSHQPASRACLQVTGDNGCNTL